MHFFVYNHIFIKITKSGKFSWFLNFSCEITQFFYQFFLVIIDLRDALEQVRTRSLRRSRGVSQRALLIPI